MAKKKTQRRTTRKKSVTRKKASASTTKKRPRRQSGCPDRFYTELARFKTAALEAAEACDRPGMRRIQGELRRYIKRTPPACDPLDRIANRLIVMLDLAMANCEDDPG